MKKIAIPIISILFILFFQNCKKTDLSKPDVAANQINTFKDSAKAWLNAQKSGYTDSRFIDTIQNGILWDDLSIESESYLHQTILYVPVKYNGNNTGMIFNIAEKGIVLGGYFAEIPAQYGKTATPDFIDNLYSHKKNNLTASVTAFDLSKSFMWELGYQNGLYKYKKLVTNNKDNKRIAGGNNNSASQRCIDWYLVTYYSDGSQTEDYVGTTCDNCNQERKITGNSASLKVSCGGNGGGGGDIVIPITFTPLSSPSQAKAVITKNQNTNSSFHANVINTGLFILANLNVNYDFDFVNKTVDSKSVNTYIEDGIAVGVWKQTDITNVYTYGNSIYFTIIGTCTTSFPGVPYTLVTTYTILVEHNLNTNIVKFDNISSSSQGLTGTDENIN